MAIKLLIGFLIFVAAIATYVVVQPTDFHIERSMIIHAPVNVVFAEVNDFHNWLAWSPWTKMDPKAKYSYEGPPSGVGSSFHWSGNRRIGVGKATITDSSPNSWIKIKLEFLTPFTATNTAEFHFKENGADTVVTWGMNGKNTFISKFFSVFFDMDKKVGNSFDNGLSSIKEISETHIK